MEKSEHTIGTLKELFDTKIKALEDKCEADKNLLTSNAEHAAAELVKQAAEYERRLSDLNHEAARIAAANAANVSKDVYEADRKTNDEWKHRIETAVNSAVPQSEYRAYKDSTSTALTLQAGKREGVGLSAQTVLSVILGLAAVAAIVFGIAAIFIGRSPPPVVYMQPAPSAARPGG